MFYSHGESSVLNWWGSISIQDFNVNQWNDIGQPINKTEDWFREVKRGCNQYLLKETWITSVRHTRSPTCDGLLTANGKLTLWGPPEHSQTNELYIIVGFLWVSVVSQKICFYHRVIPPQRSCGQLLNFTKRLNMWHLKFVRWSFCFCQRHKAEGTVKKYYIHSWLLWKSAECLNYAAFKWLHVYVNKTWFIHF